MEKMMHLVRQLDLNGLKDLWDRTSQKNDAGTRALRDAVMNRLEEMDADKFDEWLDDEDFTRFAQ